MATDPSLMVDMDAAKANEKISSEEKLRLVREQIAFLKDGEGEK